MRRTAQRLRSVALLAVLLAFALVAGSGCLGRSAPGVPAVLGGPSGVEFAGLTDWTNSEPLTLAAQREQRRVVLVDFWTYTCVNCIRTLPYLKQWQDRYASVGLTIVGVHAPEFDFEHDPANVRRAVEAEGIRYTHFGEGDYDATERAIRAALTDAGRDVSAIPTGGLAAPERDTGATITRELYGGYERNFDTRGVYAAQRAYYGGPDQTHDYTDVTGQRDKDVWYLQGTWRGEREAIVHARATTSLEDYLAFRFIARSVNVVMQPRTPGTPYEVVVELDGWPLKREEAGTDVRFDAAGRSLVTVDLPKMYGLVILPTLGDHELKLRSNSPDFAMYAVTFGAYTSGS